MSKAFIGIDVAKEYSTAQGIDSDEKKLFYLRFSTDAAGFAELRIAIKGCGLNLGRYCCCDGVHRLLSYQPLFLPMCRGTSLCGSKSASDIQIWSGVIEKDQDR